MGARCLRVSVERQTRHNCCRVSPPLPPASHDVDRPAAPRRRLGAPALWHTRPGALFPSPWLAWIPPLVPDSRPLGLLGFLWASSGSSASATRSLTNASANTRPVLPSARQLLKAKHLGAFGALALIFNAATGPGIPFTPSNFQNPGWLFTSFAFLLFTVISGFSALFIIEAIQAIPGNLHFQGNVEYATLINFYFGPIEHVIGQFFLYGSLQSNAIQNIALASQVCRPFDPTNDKLIVVIMLFENPLILLKCATTAISFLSALLPILGELIYKQAIDNLLLSIFKKTCGFTLGAPKAGWICVTQSLDTPSPFGYKPMLFTLGYLVVLILTVPLGIVNLDDNINVQIGAFFISMCIIIQWCSASIATGWDFARTPAVVPFNLNYGQVVGTIMLNLAITTIIPSWINLKSKDVSAQKVVWSSLMTTTSVYIIMGIIVALGFNIDSSQNVMPAIFSTGVPLILSRITVSMFAFVMLVPSIPVSLIISKNNLVQNKIAPERISVVLAFVVPWGVAIAFLTGDALIEFQNWTSLVFVATTNFIIPILIYFKCADFRRAYNNNRMLSAKQRDLLKSIHDTSTTIKKYIDNGGRTFRRKERRHRRQTRERSPMRILGVPVPMMNTLERLTGSGNTESHGSSQVNTAGTTSSNAIDNLPYKAAVNLDDQQLPSQSTIADTTDASVADGMLYPDTSQPLSPGMQPGRQGSSSLNPLDVDSGLLYPGFPKRSASGSRSFNKSDGGAGDGASRTSSVRFAKHPAGAASSSADDINIDMTPDDDDAVDADNQYDESAVVDTTMDASQGGEGATTRIGGGENQPAYLLHDVPDPEMEDEMIDAMNRQAAADGTDTGETSLGGAVRTQDDFGRRPTIMSLFSTFNRRRRHHSAVPHADDGVMSPQEATIPMGQMSLTMPRHVDRDVKGEATSSSSENLPRPVTDSFSRQPALRGVQRPITPSISFTPPQPSSPKLSTPSGKTGPALLSPLPFGAAAGAGMGGSLSPALAQQNPTAPGDHLDAHSTGSHTTASHSLSGDESTGDDSGDELGDHNGRHPPGVKPGNRRGVSPNGSNNSRGSSSILNHHDTTGSKHVLSRIRTLPANPAFRSPAFRTVPHWFPVRARVIAWSVLIATTIVTICNIGLNFFSSSSSSN